MSQKISVREVVSYNGHSMSSKGAVNLTLKASYSELSNTIMLTQLLNNDVKIKAKIPNKSTVMSLGEFRVKQIIIDGDGESVLKFNGLSDYVEMDNLNILPLNDEEGREFVVMMMSEIEEEGEGENDE